MTQQNWHGYIYLPKAAGITTQEWKDVRGAIRQVMEQKFAVVRSELKFRERLSLSGDAVIYCVSIPARVVSQDGRAALARIVQQAIPRFSVEQVEMYLGNSLEVFGGPGSSWLESAAAARAMMNGEIERWQHEIENPQ